MKRPLALIVACATLLGSTADVTTQPAPIRLVVQAYDMGAAHAINVGSL
jgi:hypothetical protein